MTDEKLLSMAKLAVELYEGLPQTEEGTDAAQLINDGISLLEHGQLTLRMSKPDPMFRWPPVTAVDYWLRGPGRKYDR